MSLDFGEVPAIVKTENASRDDRGEHQVKWGTTIGQLWQVGRHRIICGDSLDPGNFERLRRGGLDEPGLLVTDPPYGVNYDPSWRIAVRGQWGETVVGTVASDNRADWREVFQYAGCAVAYVWHGGLHAGEVFESLVAAGYEVRSQIIWVKQHFVMSRGDYHWRHEPCWYAVRKGCKSDFALHKSVDGIAIRKQRTHDTVWEVRNLNPFGHSNDDERTSHSTQKPIECMARPIRNHTHALILDPFLGSGTTMEAAQRENRTCYGIEIDPGYVGIILDRMQRLGLEPKLL